MTALARTRLTVGAVVDCPWYLDLILIAPLGYGWSSMESVVDENKTHHTASLQPLGDCGCLAVAESATIHLVLSDWDAMGLGQMQ